MSARSRHKADVVKSRQRAVEARARRSGGSVPSRGRRPLTDEERAAAEAAFNDLLVQRQEGQE